MEKHLQQFIDESVGQFEKQLSNELLSKFGFQTGTVKVRVWVTQAKPEAKTLKKKREQRPKLRLSDERVSPELIDRMLAQKITKREHELLVYFRSYGNNPTKYGIIRGRWGLWGNHIDALKTKMRKSGIPLTIARINPHQQEEPIYKLFVVASPVVDETR